jgi:two-component system, NtrC family, sensor kinase
LDTHAFPMIVAAVACLLMGYLVYAKKKADLTNQLFALVFLCAFFWNLETAALSSAPNRDLARLWGSIFRIGKILFPPTFLYFVLHFSHPQGFSARLRKILLTFFGIAVFWVAINWTPYFTRGAIAYSWGYKFQWGPLYLLFLLQAIACILLAIYFLILKYPQVDRYQQQRFKYFFMAIIVSVLLGGSFSILPGSNLEGYPFKSLALTVGLLLASYPVAQHRLVDLRLFTARSLAFFFSLTIMVIPTALAVIFLERCLLQEFSLPIFFILIFSMGATWTLVFNKIKVRVDRPMQQFIVKDKYGYHQTVEEFSRNLVGIVDLNRLLHLLADTLEQKMGVKRISIFLYDSDKGIYRQSLLRGWGEKEPLPASLPPENPGMQFLQKRKEAFLYTELRKGVTDAESQELSEILARLGTEVCLPLLHQNRFLGFITLGPKPEEETYYREDLDLLNTVGKQVATAIENASLYENMKKSYRIMRREDRLASVGSLIASLAHEIRNPLVSIKTFTQLLPDRMDDEEFRNYFMKVASGEIDRLTSLINELVLFARPSEPNLRGEDVNALIEKIELLIAPEARKKKIQLSKHYASDLPLVMVDAEQIKQVLLNVLLNALQSMSAEGDVWIETRVVQSSHEEINGRFIQIEVRDSGSGIPKENLERIFDPFFSTRPDNTGLGLAISHQIIHEHGGFIDLESEVNKGTSVRLHLPLRSEEVGLASP